MDSSWILAATVNSNLMFNLNFAEYFYTDLSSVIFVGIRW